MSGAPNLTSNDLAGSAMAIGLALAWWRDWPASGFKRREVKKLKALLAKINAAADHNNPFTNSDDMPSDWGDEPIYAPLPLTATPR